MIAIQRAVFISRIRSHRMGSKLVGSVAFLDARTPGAWVGEPDAGLKYLQLPPDSGGGQRSRHLERWTPSGGHFGRGFSGSAKPGGDVAGRRLADSANQSDLVGGWKCIRTNFSAKPASDDQRWLNHRRRGWPLLYRDASNEMGEWPRAAALHSNLQPTSSVAMFVTDNGIVFGTATTSDGHIHLVRWDADGNPEVLDPPPLFGVVGLTSIGVLGAAAGGWIAQQTGCISSDDPACNQSPSVWTISNGFTVLPENGQEDFYYYSTVNAISDGGRVAVGALTAASRGPGDPPDLGFVWTADLGMFFIDDLLFGQPNPDYPSADQVSSDGSRVMVTGNPPRNDDHDTSQLILDLSWPNATPTPTPTATPTPTPTPTLTPCPPPWQFVASMPVDVYGAAGASDGTYVYEAGGYSFQSGCHLGRL